MARKNGMSHLNVNIQYDKKHKCYRIVIDGDVFWADSYDHAIMTLMEILIRDEVSRGKIH